jgi:hypothetical protein
MTDRTDRRAVHIGKLMAATSALALSLGMTVQADAASNQDKHVPGQTRTQIKGESNQDKWTGFLKHNTNDHKISTQIKLDSVQHKGQSNQIKGQSNQLKYEGTTAVQHKHDTPSTQLNPQPEPPMQTGPGTTPH